MAKDELAHFSVVWKGVTALPVNQIIPRLTEFSHSLPDISQSEFEHLVIVHQPELEPEVEVTAEINSKINQSIREVNKKISVTDF